MLDNTHLYAYNVGINNQARGKVMKAFYNHDGTLVKVYDMGQDWKVVSPGVERWYSTWSSVPGRGIERAIADFCRSIGLELNPSRIVYT